MKQERTDAQLLPLIREWFVSLPPEPIAGWTSMDVDDGRPDPVATGWVDVEVPALLHHLEVAWVWTIVAPEDEQPRGELTIKLPYNRPQAWTPVAISSALGAWVANHCGRDDVGFTWDPTLPSMMRSWVVLIIAENDEHERGSS
jgi:hypothetical protein